MRACVLGAGVAGITCAYYLAREGFDVSLVERNSGAGLETSYANGGQLSYSYVAPLAGPGVLPKVPPWLLRRDAPLRFYPAFDPHQWNWLLQFVLACTQARSDATTAALLPLAFHSRDLLHAIVAEEAFAFDYARTGKLVVFPDAGSFAGARHMMAFQATLGCEQQALDAADCVALDPALSTMRTRIAGGIYTPSEDAGDCYQFCVGLQGAIARRWPRTQFLFETRVEGFRRDARRIRALVTARGEIEAELFVLAAGLASRKLALPLGIRLPIYPLKGYSLTLDVRGRSGAPRVSVTDAKRKVVYARLGDELRVAGMVDLAGYRNAIDPQRVATLASQVEEAFPGCADFSAPRPWCGLRPATPRGTPILGRSPYENLLLDVGHGALGFTLACGSAAVVAALAAGRAPGVPIDAFRLAQE